MQARALSVRPSEQNLRGALEILEKAVSRRPTFAPAHCMLARVRATFLVFDLPIEGGLSSIERDARRALALDASLGDAHAALAWVRAFQGRWIEAELHFRSAMSLGAQSDAAAVHMTLVTHSVGHFERALSEALELHRPEPSDGFYPVCIANSYAALSNDAEARRYADIARGLGQPRDHAPLQDLYAELALRSGNYTEAAQLMTAALSKVMRAGGGEESLKPLVAALTDGSNRQEALASLHTLETAVSSEGIGQIDTKRLLSWYARLGDSAYAIINRCLDRCTRLGTVGAAGVCCGALIGERFEPILASICSQAGWVSRTTGCNTVRRLNSGGLQTRDYPSSSHSVPAVALCARCLPSESALKPWSYGLRMEQFLQRNGAPLCFPVNAYSGIEEPTPSSVNERVVRPKSNAATQSRGIRSTATFHAKSSLRFPAETGSLLRLRLLPHL